MNLIELLLYCALLSSFISGSIFSAFSLMISIQHQTDHAHTEQQKGFVALISTVLIASILLLMAVAYAQTVGDQYDAYIHMYRRSVVTGYVRTCLDDVTRQVASDYFFEVTSVVGNGVCVIESVIRDANSVSIRHISVSSEFEGIHARITSDIQVRGGAVSKIYENFIYF